MDRGVLVLIIGAIILAFLLGKVQEKKEIIKRAQEYNQECYTNSNLEYIIFGESQL